MINLSENINSENKLAQKILEVKNLSVSVETVDKRINILRGINLTLSRGEVMAVVGESGSGKSTLAQAIIGVLDTPPAFIESGEIYFDGMRIYPSKNKINFRGAGINMVFQEPLVSLNPVYTIRRQLEESLKVAGTHLNKENAEAELKEILSELMIRDVERVLNSYPHQLSGGMRQRVAIAMSMVQKPKLLILDEPTTGLDLIVQRKIMQLLLKLKKDYGTTLMIITHDLAVAANMADRMYVMYAGQIVEHGTRDEIINSPLHPYSRMLRDSVPTGYKDSGPLRVTEGNPPDLANLPQGCAFNPRCPAVIEICKQKEPDFQEFGERGVRCWLYDKNIRSK